MLVSLVSDIIGLPHDQCTFLITQVLALCMSLAFRSYLPPSKFNTNTRHLVASLVGILLGFFCFEYQFLHVVFVSLVSYLSMRYLPRQRCHLIVLAFTITYLSFLHIYFLIYHYGERKFDISSPMMILVQKLTYLGFSYNDGIVPSDKLIESQRHFSIKNLPTFLEFLSYIFNFQSVIIGPSTNFNDYVDFINGNSVLKHKKKVEWQGSDKHDSNNNNHSYANNNSSNRNSDNHYQSTNGSSSNGNACEIIIHQPSIQMVLLRKGLLAIVLSVLFVNLSEKYSIETFLVADILSKPLWYRFFYYHVCVFSKRVFYYLAWTISDIVNNASGFGFNGYDEKGNAIWDLCINVHIWELETSSSAKKVIDNWHISTQLWLRRIAYDRLPQGKTMGVFVLSAFWHGFYPGYYLTFVLAGFLIYIGRGIRRNIRPIFLKNKLSKVLYDFVGWICTIFSICYAIAPFFLLDFKKSFEFYGSFYWIVHICVIIFAISLPGKSFKSKSTRATSSVELK